MAIQWQRKDISQGRGSMVFTPLVAGVHHEVPTSKVPEDGFLRIEGFQVRPKGLRKLPVFSELGNFYNTPWSTSDAADAQPVHVLPVDIIEEITKYPFVVYTRGSAFFLKSSGLTQIPWWDAFTFEVGVDQPTHQFTFEEEIVDSVTSANYPVFGFGTLRIQAGDRIYLSTTTYNDLLVANQTIGIITVTIATPAVFTLISHGLEAGDIVYFTTTGALPTGLTINTVYWVLATDLTVNTFKVSALSGGSAVNTSGTQSGVHTMKHAEPYFVDIINSTVGVGSLDYNDATSNPPASGAYFSFSILRGGARADLNMTPVLPLELCDVGKTIADTWVVSENYPIGRIIVDDFDNVLFSSFLTMTNDAVDWNYPLEQPVFVDGVQESSPLASIWTSYTGAQFRSFFFVGNTLEDDGQHTNRIRWSNPFSPLGNWTDGTAFFDLSETETVILRILPNDEQLMVYGANSIWYGFETSDPTLPVAFRKIDTGGVGILNKYAVCQAMGTHFFVGQNNIYVTQGAQSPKQIGTPVLLKTLFECQRPEGVRATHDVDRQCVLFGFPKASQDIEEVWIFDYQTGSWSMQFVTCNYLEQANLGFSVTATQVGSVAADTLTLPASDFSLDTPRVFIGIPDPLSSDVYLLGKTATLGIRETNDYVPQNANEALVTIETGDQDFDNPDIIKTWQGIVLQIEEQDFLPIRKPRIDFTVYTSVDQGETWTNQGVLTLKSTADMTGVTDIEDALSVKPNTGTSGQLSFLVRGETLRIRLVSTSLVASYDVVQYNLWVKASAPVGG